MLQKIPSLLLLRRLLIVFALYQLCRFLFLLFNWDTFQDLDFRTFWGGLVFDFSAIGFINLIFTLAHLLPGYLKSNPLYQKVLKISFYVVNLIFIATNFVDFQYFKFTGRRSSFGLITAKGMENEIGGLIFSFLVEFWYLPLIFIVVSIIFWRFLGSLKITNAVYSRKIFLKETGILILCLGIGFIMARGGFNKKPVRIVDATIYNYQSTALVLNTPFCILKTIGKKEFLTIPDYYKTEELIEIFDPVLDIKPDSLPNKKNVVILILESFGDENINSGHTPFLDSLLQESLYFKNGFANGRLSIDAVPSILSSIPSLFNVSFISSSYSVNEVYGLPKILKDNGYYTVFFHGAFNGSQNFDQYSKIAGFDKYYGKNEYVGKDAFDGKWGIFDEEFLQFFCSELSIYKKPFFATLFTISSHNPYTIPEKYKGKFPKGNTKILESISYTDFALKKFFECAKQQPWYNNTLFVLTADHCSGEPVLPEHKTNVGRYRIPILFFDPSNKSINEVSEKNFQQIDIMPSIIDYLNINAKMVSFGKSYTSDKDFVVYFLADIYYYIDGDYYLAFDGTKTIELYNFKKDVLLKDNLLKKEPQQVQKMEKFLKAYIQSFNERVINNKLVEYQVMKNGNNL